MDSKNENIELVRVITDRLCEIATKEYGPVRADIVLMGMLNCSVKFLQECNISANAKDKSVALMNTVEIIDSILGVLGEVRSTELAALAGMVTPNVEPMGG